VPVPVPAIVAEPPGNTAQFTVLSAPALGFAVITMLAVSVQPLALVQMKLYVPAALKVVIVVVGLVAVVMVAVPGLPVCALHVPVPTPDIVTDPPGSTTQDNELSAPALGFAVTTTAAVSVHPLALVQMKLYVPATLKVVIVVVGLVVLVMVAVPGLPV
jgi:hypothetical protein